MSDHTRAQMQDIYESGLVKRHHTNPSEAVQTIGHHAWGVAMILDYIFPQATKACVLMALQHDCGERWVGDLPAQVKWENEKLKEIHGRLEDMKLAQLGFAPDLDPLEWMAIKTADLVELWMYSQHRIKTGDCYFYSVRSNVEHWFNDHPDNFKTFPLAKELVRYATPDRPINVTH